MSVGLGPCELLTYISTVYVVLEVVLKLQVISCGLTSSHSLGDGGTGLILTVTESVGGVYINDEEIPYCNNVDDIVGMNTCTYTFKRASIHVHVSTINLDIMYVH